jgi:acetyl-CoA/propionyl-CoA carboxylase biotin carboxyl carrier protein
MYDPMIAKLIVWDEDREKATERMIRALGEYQLEGVKSLIPFHIGFLSTDEWKKGETGRNLIEDKEWLKQFEQPKPDAPAEEDDEEEKIERSYAVEVSGRKFDVKVIGAAPVGVAANGAAPAKKAPKRGKRSSGGGGAPGELVSPIQGTVLKVEVEKGASVEEGALICVIEAMKMENEITAPSSGTIEELNVSAGGSVATGDTIAVIK